MTLPLKTWGHKEESAPGLTEARWLIAISSHTLRGLKGSAWLPSFHQAYTENHTTSLFLCVFILKVLTTGNTYVKQICLLFSRSSVCVFRYLTGLVEILLFPS